MFRMLTDAEMQALEVEHYSYERSQFPYHHLNVRIFRLTLADGTPNISIEKWRNH